MPQAEKKVTDNKDSKEKAKPSVKRTNFSALYPEDSPLKLLVEENPKKNGSKSRTRFQAYFGAKTVGDAMVKQKNGDPGVTYQDIVYDIGHNFIQVG